MRHLTRRDFLKLSLLTSAYAIGDRRAFSAPCVDTDVLIIGAGMAGLRAADFIDLSSSGAVSTIILEARDRIGGRVYTDRLSIPGTPIERGASWVINTLNPDNCIMQAEVPFNGTTTVPTSHSKQAVYKARGRRAGDRLVTSIANRFENISDKVDDLRMQLAQDRSLQAGYAAVTRRRGPKLNFSIYDNIEGDYASDISDMSLLHYDCAEKYIDTVALPDGDEENPEVLVTNGYDTIVNGVAVGTDIRLNHQVTNIAWDNTGVTVTTAANGCFTARRLIITVPLGILKQSVNSGNPITFANALPPEKIAAINGLGMGTLNKVYLKFPNAFWEGQFADDVGGIDFIDRIAKVKGEWADWFNVDNSTGQPILCALNAGEFGERMELSADNVLVSDAMAVLRRMFGRRGNVVPDPTDFVITRWKADPYSMGSYAHVLPGAIAGARNCDTLEAEVYETIAEPVDNRLFFAGEHTHEKYSQSVHGAYLSGERAGGEVVDFFGFDPAASCAI